MFEGDTAALTSVLDRAAASARRLGHLRVGVEHLLIGLAEADDPVAELLTRHGATRWALEDAAIFAAPLGAGAAADRQCLGALGIDVAGLDDIGAARWMDRRVGRLPIFPLDARRSHQVCAQMNPPLGLDVQAAYEASLRLALARRDDRHRPEHLAMALVSLDSGVDWVLTRLGADRGCLLQDLEHTFPAPRHPLLHPADVSVLRSTRQRDIVRRYQRTTGRSAVEPVDLVRFVAH